MSKMSNDPMFGRPVKPGQNKPFKPTTGGPMPKFEMPGMGNDMRKPGGTNVASRPSPTDKNMARKQAIQKRFLNK
jgi:hypothetical protein